MKDFGVKHFVAIVLCAVVALVVGRLGPQSQIRALQAQLKETKECAPSKKSTGTDVARMFQGKPWEAPIDEPAPQPAPKAEPEDAVEPADDGIQIDFEGEDIEGEGLDDGNLDKIREAMEIRIAQTEQALSESDLSEAQIDQIHEAADTLNSDLEGLARDLVAEAAGEEPSRRQMMMLAADTLDAVINAETAMLETVPESERGDMDAQLLDPMAYVEPNIVEILSELDQ